jgi:hypothetical protein
MSAVEDIIAIVKTLPEEAQAEVRDFARFLREKRIAKVRGASAVTPRAADNPRVDEPGRSCPVDDTAKP